MLTAAEEKDLVCRIAKGDKPAFDALVMSHDKLAVSEAMRHYHRNGGDLADLCQESRLALVKAASIFGGGMVACRFSAYAKQAIVKHLITFSITSFRQTCHQARQHPDPDNVAARHDDDDEFDNVEPLLCLLRPDERLAVELRFGLDGGGERSLSEVARSLGLTRKRAAEFLLQTAMRRMRGELPYHVPEPRKAA